jgi:hypothetical protein
MGAGDRILENGERKLEFKPLTWHSSLPALNLLHLLLHSICLVLPETTKNLYCACPPHSGLFIKFQPSTHIRRPNTLEKQA